MRIVTCLFLLLTSCWAKAQFSPDGGLPGSIAIHADSTSWIGFATEVELGLGWLDIADTTLGRIDFIARDAGIGAPDLDVQPLGDGGSATLSFAVPFSDQQGYDFVVFENGFSTSDTSGFFELAFVEVSSNGIDFVRFPNTSLSTAENFAGPFAELDSRLIDGLAGRFSAPYGAPFDLADLPIDPMLDLTSVRYVRVVDVVGTEDSAFAKTDTDGIAIIDPYPTAYNTGGFDLDAIGILGSDISSITSAPAFAKMQQTIAVKRGDFVHAFSHKTAWMDGLGKVIGRGQFAPGEAGFYFTSEGGRLKNWKKVLVY